MARKLARRRFLGIGVGAAGLMAAPGILRSGALGGAEKLNIAGIGVGGKGESDIAQCASQNVVALCDVDEKNAAASFAKFPLAKRFKDYRKLFDEEKSIDAVTVSTPDHHHATASILAMRLGKHVYCQKPLTHSVAEARLMADVAREQKVATQMGNQGMSRPRIRRFLELIRGGVLGSVSEVHVWTDRPIWPQGVGRPKETPDVPPTLDWDLWLGPAPGRPYHPAYVPFKWRGFWDFGTGALGDMGCHILALPFLALGLKDPASIEAVSSPVNDETAPLRSMITYQFPATESRGPVKLVWYDGGIKPSRHLARSPELPLGGSILIGSKDTLLLPSPSEATPFTSGAKVEDFKEIPQTFTVRAENDRDGDLAHKLEWFDACKGGPKAISSFDFAGPLTESVLLGNVALRWGGKLEWDAKGLKITNAPDANRFIQYEQRKGWQVS